MQALASRISRISPTLSTFPTLSRSRTPPCRFLAPASYANPVLVPVPVAIRAASTSSGSPAAEKTHVFVIWAPDYADKDALARRLAVREKHLRETQPGQQAGYYLFGGAFLTPGSIAAPDAPKEMAGSVLLVRAKSLEEVRANVEADIYWKSGVWDKEKVVIAPLRRAIGPVLEDDPDV